MEVRHAIGIQEILKIFLPLPGYIPSALSAPHTFIPKSCFTPLSFLTVVQNYSCSKPHWNPITPAFALVATKTTFCLAHWCLSVLWRVPQVWPILIRLLKDGGQLYLCCPWSSFSSYIGEYDPSRLPWNIAEVLQKVCLCQTLPSHSHYNISDTALYLSTVHKHSLCN